MYTLLPRETEPRLHRSVAIHDGWPCLQMRTCIIIPSYNHGETLPGVVRAAREYHPVIVVDDGSSDGSEQSLRSADCAALIRHPRNMGKCVALRAGFDSAIAMGFTHAITMDADGQHSALDIPVLETVAERSPGAFIVGVREIAKAGAPAERQVANRISNFWFRVETGISLIDTQCGLRCYPLAITRSLRTRAARYGYELEILIRAVWAGHELVAVPVRVDYAAPSSRRSHFRPLLDFARISCIHASFSFQSVCLPASLRKSLSVAAGAHPE